MIVGRFISPARVVGLGSMVVSSGTRGLSSWRLAGGMIGDDVLWVVLLKYLIGLRWVRGPRGFWRLSGKSLIKQGLEQAFLARRPG